MNSIIVIGAGAAGLMAAYELSKHGKQVSVLETKDRLGGRIHTIHDTLFSMPVEAGAEFIHGALPHTLSLLKEAGVKYHPIAGKMFHLEKGKFEKERSFNAHWNKLMKQMEALKEDMTLQNFLDHFFADEKYSELRESVKGFAGGFDLADISKASVKGLYREWNDEMGKQYRIEGGYQKIIDFLETKCSDNGVIINKNCCVKKISWQQNEVRINTMCSRFFESKKAVIAVPLSVLQAKANNKNYIEFSPEIPQHIWAANNIGYGAVIKVLLQFNENFWNKEKKDAGFFLTGEAIPTWWTQLPDENTVLTGWAGGNKAVVLQEKSDEEILDIALQSLSNAFAISFNKLRSNLSAHIVFNWHKEPDIAGGYSYDLIESTNAKIILRQSVNNTLFFAGEALFEGTPGGTVEAALASAKKTAMQVLKHL